MLVENIKEAFQNLLSNKMRSLLTMLGIIIGIAAVITITTIGSSIKSTLSTTLNSLGGNSITIYLSPEYPEDDADWDSWEYPDLEDGDYISQEMLANLKETYPEYIAGYSLQEALGEGMLYADQDHYANVSMAGVTAELLKYQTKINILKGRNITEADVDGGKRVCVISNLTAQYYFGDENPLGKQVVFSGPTGDEKFTVVGVYEYDESIFGKPDTSVPEQKRSYYAFTTVTAVLDILGSDRSGYENVSILLQVGTDPNEAMTYVTEYFAEIYSDNDTWSVESYNMASEMDTINNVITVITLAISFIAAISLIVGGVGVMNIMLVSITERTREIGIRKALGAKNKSIRQQFLVESVVLCLVGGVIGIIIGLVLGLVIGKAAEFIIAAYQPDMADYLVMNIHPSILAIVLSVGFSMVIGLFFGNYPAKKAAEMEVIDALRYE